jgi:hypothetical protein
MHPSTEARDGSAQSQPDIPPGFSIQQMSDGRNYVVPDFLLDATDLAVRSEELKKSLEVQQAPGGVSICDSSSPFVPVAYSSG